MFTSLTDFRSKPFWVLKRPWLRRVFMPSIRETTLKLEPQHFHVQQGVDGVKVALRSHLSGNGAATRFGVSLDFDDNSTFLNTARLGEGSLIVPGTSAQASSAPMVHEPWIWPSGVGGADYFPVTISNVTLDCIIALQLSWQATRQTAVNDLTGIDDVSKHERHIWQWGLNDVQPVAMDVATFSGLLETPEPSYAWNTNTATTYLGIARVTEDPEAPGVPLLEQWLHSDQVLTHPIMADLITKPSDAFPPGSPDGPTDLRPIIFLNGGVASYEFLLNVDSAGANYCPEVRQTIGKIKIKKRTMVDTAGTSTDFHEFELESNTPVRHLAFLDECDPLA